MNWFTILNIDQVDSPALVVYKHRVSENIDRLIGMMKGNVDALRPHVKTNKMAEVCGMMMEAGISKFKCATIAEAEMLGMINAPDVLLAYQPTGPKIKRLLALTAAYPNTRFACLVDNQTTATELSNFFTANASGLRVYIDLDTGMHRTGISPQQALDLYHCIRGLTGLYFKGLHAYDGHIRDTDLLKRQEKSDTAFEEVLDVATHIRESLHDECKIVAGGSPSFPTHMQRPGVECSPGTFVFWDWGYKHDFPDEPFDYAALVITRIISVINEEIICVDLGHKSVAAENPLPRVHFLNAPEAKTISQSEEHLVLKVPAGKRYGVGDVLYGVPVHICPTVALYERAHIVINNEVRETWEVIGRNRSITL